MDRRILAPLLLAALLSACSKRDEPPPAPPAPAPQAAPAPAPSGPEATPGNVMLSEGKESGALAGAAGTTGGPTNFGDPSTDSEALALADRPSGLVDALRGTPSLMQEPRPPELANTENKDVRRTRSYAMQPPTIPHKTDNYQVDKYANKCLTCHSRSRTEESQAPPVSITHYTDRSGNFLAQISPRRYFCEQCHVVQLEVKPLVANTFQDVDTLLKQQQAKPREQ
ncbi:MAG TPA: nitrate reductase cytochrome c-type subunit [Aromatoleum sp.]|uniref:nitrate reductase cytochrome c-type subunit n=1 Tax=Aromatoleum sp. TaxID=2307007 RepID=UPI002B4788DD|nr:nitrate reductase cytochrome c-type subunit [Aromatoleum sp.]HJV27375.1 nitrate reductase cytochrome c-type subunit [Aromatoleum sp.]